MAQLDAREMYDVLQHRVCAQWRAAYAAPAVTTPLLCDILFRIPVRACVVGTHTYAHKTTNTHGPHSNTQVGELQHHMDQRISNIEKIFVTTVAPLVETLDILVRQQTENAALMAVRNANKP